MNKKINENHFWMIYVGSFILIAVGAILVNHVQFEGFGFISAGLGVYFLGAVIGYLAAMNDENKKRNIR